MENVPISFRMPTNYHFLSRQKTNPKNLIHLADDPFWPKCHCGWLASAALYQGRKSDIYYGLVKNVMINSTQKSK